MSSFHDKVSVSLPYMHLVNALIMEGAYQTGMCHLTLTSFSQVAKNQCRHLVWKFCRCKQISCFYCPNIPLPSSAM